MTLKAVLSKELAPAMLIVALACGAAAAQGAAASATAPATAASTAGAAATTAASALVGGSEREKPESSFLDSPESSEQPGSAVPNIWASLKRLVGATLLIVALLVGGLVLIKRFMRRSLNFARGGDKPLRVVEKIALGPKNQVCLLNACGRYLVIGVTEKEINVLMEVTLPGESGGDEPEPRAGGFSKDFASMLSKNAPAAPGEK